MRWRAAQRDARCHGEAAAALVHLQCAEISAVEGRRGGAVRLMCGSRPLSGSHVWGRDCPGEGYAATQYSVSSRCLRPWTAPAGCCRLLAGFGRCVPRRPGTALGRTRSLIRRRGEMAVLFAESGVYPCSPPRHTSSGVIGGGALLLHVPFNEACGDRGGPARPSAHSP